MKGVGGSTLGGGLSFFSPRYGWTCDSALSFEVVLANGSIVEASDAQNQDLLFALRGGNNNFGIVTRITLETFHQGLIWSGTFHTSIDYADNQIAEFVEISSADPYDQYASFSTTFGYSQIAGHSAIYNHLTYTKEEENPPIYRGIRNLPLQVKYTDTTRMAELAKRTEAIQLYGVRYVSCLFFSAVEGD